jgi:putative addiction module component (TIGR02574 family)
LDSQNELQQADAVEELQKGVGYGSTSNTAGHTSIRDRQLYNAAFFGFGRIFRRGSQCGKMGAGGSLKSMKRELVAEILALPVAERVRLVEAIWDSISAAPEALPLTESQKRELDRRLAEFEANSEEGSSLEEVFARIRRAS